MVRFAPKACRKTFKTLGAKIPKNLPDKIQGDADLDVSSKHYDHYDSLDEKREAMKTWCHWLERMVWVLRIRWFRLIIHRPCRINIVLLIVDKCINIAILNVK